MQTVLFVLAIMWSVYIGMWLLSLNERRSLSSIAAFHEHLAVLSRTSPGWSGTPSHSGRRAGGHVSMTITEARSRRRRVLTWLAAAASLTAGLAIVSGGGLMLVLHLLADVVLVGYLMGLVNARQVAVERRRKVVYFPAPATAPGTLPVPARPGDELAYGYLRHTAT